LIPFTFLESVLYFCYVFHTFLGKKHFLKVFCIFVTYFISSWEKNASYVQNGAIFKTRTPSRLGNQSGGNIPEAFVKSAFNLLHNFSDHKVDTQNLHYTDPVKGGSQLNALIRYSFAAYKRSRSFCLVILNSRWI